MNLSGSANSFRNDFIDAMLREPPIELAWLRLLKAFEAVFRRWPVLLVPSFVVY